MHRDALFAFVVLGAIAVWNRVDAGAPPPAQPPHFASLSSGKVYMREGPSYAHRVLWVYRRKNLPVEVLSEFDVWRRVQDSKGTVGWVHSSMISDKRTVVVVGPAEAAIKRSRDSGSRTLALAQPGAIARLEACDETCCEISAEGVDGWIDKKNIWGVRAGETFN